MKDNIFGFRKNLNIPDNSTKVPMLQDFENFTYASACAKKAELHTKYYLKLNSIFNTAETLKDEIADLLEIRIHQRNPYYKLPEIDNVVMDFGSEKIVNPKITAKINKCLSSGLTNSKNDGERGYKDILDPNSPLLKDQQVDVKSEVDKLKQIFKKDITEAANEAIKQINKIIMGFLKEQDRILFSLLDKLNEFIKTTKFIEVYKQFKDADKCIKENCKVLIPFLYTDEFLYYEEDPTRFILPFTLNENKILISKVLLDISPEQKKQCDNIQKTYNSYLETKKNLAKLSAQKLINSGKPKEENPYATVVDNLSFSKEDTVNTLF